jgi:hypothetical protein
MYTKKRRSGVGAAVPASGKVHRKSSLAQLYAQACQVRWGPFALRLELRSRHRSAQLKAFAVKPQQTILANLENRVLLLQPKELTANEISALCKFIQHRKVSKNSLQRGVTLCGQYVRSMIVLVHTCACAQTAALLEVVVLTRGDLTKPRATRSSSSHMENQVQMSEKIWVSLVKALKKCKCLRSLIVHQYQDLSLSVLHEIIGALESCTRKLCVLRLPLLTTIVVSCLRAELALSS